MVRFDGDHVNWVLVVILVAMALLLALVSSSGYGVAERVFGPPHDEINQTKQSILVSVQDRKEARTPSEIWYIAIESYRAGNVAESRLAFEKVLSAYPLDPAARMWAGIASFRSGDRAAAIRHWESVWCDDLLMSDAGVWPAVALAATHLETGQSELAARFIVPLERGDLGPDIADHPLVSFYAALVYEQLATTAPKFGDALDGLLAEKFSPALASNDRNLGVSPNSQSWLIFLAKRSLQRTIHGARSIEWAAPLVPETATVEPSFAPTVEDLLSALGSADFAAQARRKLRALDIYESPPNRHRVLPGFDDPDLLMKRGRFIA